MSKKQISIVAGLIVVIGLTAWWLVAGFGATDSPAPPSSPAVANAPDSPAPSSEPTSTPTPEPTPLPLAGKLVVIDPGHQLGNSRHASQIRKQVPAGNGTTKACNSTGTASNAGYPEATFAFGVASELKPQLEALGATVLMTRDSNEASLWGPCVDARGAAGNSEKADAKISIHGDGSAANHHGFHLIVSTANKTWQAPSTQLAEDARAALEAKGFARSTYIGNGTGLSFRADIATNNLSEMPTIMAELGNMRNTNDAAVMSSAEGQLRYATALAAATEAFLSR